MKKWSVLFFSMISFQLHAQKTSIIPQPVNLVIKEGSFVVDNNTSLKFNPADKNLNAAAVFFSSYIKSISGITILQNIRKQKTVELKIAKTNDIGDEDYLLNVSPSSIVVTANTKTGIIYALQTLFQTLPAIRTNAALQIPAMEVKDYPRFKWWGMHLDVCRHFFSPHLVKEYIDLMATYKFNTFHWHLTDNLG